MTKKRKDIAGERFTRSTGIKLLDPNKHGQSLGLFLCDCGKEFTAIVTEVRCARTTSCGCYRTLMKSLNMQLRYREVCLEPRELREFSKHPLYAIYHGMIRRCTQPDHPAWKNYGGRGIFVCEDWLKDPLAFYRYALPLWKPGLDMHRINNSRGYEPGNIAFVTRQENMLHTRSRVQVRRDDMRQLDAHFLHGLVRDFYPLP